MKNKHLGVIAGLIAAAALLGTPEAKATLTFTLAEGNSAISGYPGPYGTVSITRVDNNNATVTLTALNAGAYKYSFGDGGTIGLNLAGGGTFSFSGITGSTLNEGLVQNLADQPTQGAGTLDGWGNFNFVLDSFDGFDYSVTSLSFNVHTTSGLWTTEDAILEGNNKGNSVAGHVFIRDLNDQNVNATGFATVPEPSTYIAGALLLLPVLAQLRRWKRGSVTT